ncbi:hypothetical protein JTE90_019567 [Oedothorax gibbosus]|uniref:Uncharacterized protein n=1 Tax=Oedothorax gibbosus TaxID=931172 RepID=A0AAV6V6M6_9ARAC|nr:hypothetical protein JTE90_019567 [Oedothorax gibbosus]
MSLLLGSEQNLRKLTPRGCFKPHLHMTGSFCLKSHRWKSRHKSLLEIYTRWGEGWAIRRENEGVDEFTFPCVYVGYVDGLCSNGSSSILELLKHA